jgi:nitrite reductase (NO-forming)
MLASLERTRRRPIDRSADRRVTLVGIALALMFLALALLSFALPESVRRGAWLPLHLALAGGATTAIASVLPFFVAAFAAAPPADSRLRAAALSCVAGGTGVVTLGIVGMLAPLAAAGGVLFIGGVCLLALAVVRPLAGALGPSRGIVTRAYLGALVMVALGALLGTLDLAGFGPVAQAWDRLKPAHAWLNLVGFVSLTIVATLVHFWPTVVGARIGAFRSGRVAVVATSLAPIVVGLGYWLASDLVVQTGALLGLTGALAAAVYAARVWRTRAHWTTDPGWHRFAIGGLASALAWFTIGMAVLAGRALVSGAWPGGWSIDWVMGPLVVGWAGLAIVASATHLVPAVGPGGPAAHARQRVVLGRWSLTRLLALNTGVGAVAVGLPARMDAVAAAGAVILAATLALSLALFAIAIAVARGPAQAGN